MKKHTDYPEINIVKTGEKIKKEIQAAGYAVKDIQNYLMLSCPQPVYRWFKGKALPSVNHLYALSRLLDVQMEDLIVSAPPISEQKKHRCFEDRIMAYWKRLKRIA